MIPPRLSAALRDRRGVTAVEFSLIAIPLLVIIFACFEVGQAMWIREALQETAMAGARCMGVLNSNCAPGGVYNAAATTTYVEAAARNWNVAIPDSGVTQSRAATCAGVTGFSQVTVSYTFVTVAPGLLGPLGAATPLAATACFPNNA